MKPIILALAITLLLLAAACDNEQPYQKPEGGVVWVGYYYFDGQSAEKFLLVEYDALNSSKLGEFDISNYVPGFDYYEDIHLTTNEKDNAVWFAYDNNIFKFSPTGELLQTRSFEGGQVVDFELDPNHNCCWVSLLSLGVEKISADDLSILEQCPEVEWSGEISANRGDGGCWVIDNTDYEYNVDRISADGAILCKYGEMEYPVNVAVDPRDSSCWVIDIINHRLAKISATGEELFVINDIDFHQDYEQVKAFYVHPKEGSCFINCGNDNQFVRKYSAQGELLIQAEVFRPSGMDINMYDDSLWFCGYYMHIEHYSADFEKLGEILTNNVRNISVNDGE
jgi:hypothetical protein